MAEGSKVKKGFFTYLLIFILMIIAFIAVSIVIMIFNPGKNILGFKYNRHNSVDQVVATTDDSHQELNLFETKYDVIEIDAGVADVCVEANDSINKDCVLVTNRIRGFSKADVENDFKYSVNIDDKTLKVKIDAVKGFLNFSDDLSVKIHIAMRQQAIDIFKDTKFIVKTTSGNVNIGGVRNEGHSLDIAIGELDIETVSGNITVTGHTNGAEFDGRDAYEFNSPIKFNTRSGNINLYDCSFGLRSVDNNQEPQPKILKINAVEGLSADVGEGRFQLGTYIGKLNISSTKANISVREINGSLNASLRSSIVNIDKIDGDLDFSDGNEVMDSNHITINKVTGFVNIPDGRSSNITIYDVGGESNIHTTTGNVTLGAKNTLVDRTTYVETEKGNINVYFSGNNYSRILKTVSGKINVSFEEVILSGDKNQFVSEQNNIALNFNKNSKIKFKFSKATSDDEFDLSKVSFDITNGKKIETNPYLYNTSGSTFATIEISTNKQISLDLI